MNWYKYKNKFAEENKFAIENKFAAERHYRPTEKPSGEALKPTSNQTAFYNYIKASGVVIKLYHGTSENMFNLLQRSGRMISPIVRNTADNEGRLKSKLEEKQKMTPREFYKKVGVDQLFFTTSIDYAYDYANGKYGPRDKSNAVILEYDIPLSMITEINDIIFGTDYYYTPAGGEVSTYNEFPETFITLKNIITTAIQKSTKEDFEDALVSITGFIYRMQKRKERNEFTVKGFVDNKFIKNIYYIYENDKKVKADGDKSWYDLNENTTKKIKINKYTEIPILGKQIYNTILNDDIGLFEILPEKFIEGVDKEYKIKALEFKIKNENIFNLTDDYINKLDTDEKKIVVDAYNSQILKVEKIISHFIEYIFGTKSNFLLNNIKPENVKYIEDFLISNMGNNTNNIYYYKYLFIIPRVLFLKFSNEFIKKTSKNLNNHLLKNISLIETFLKGLPRELTDSIPKRIIDIYVKKSIYDLKNNPFYYVEMSSIIKNKINLNWYIRILNNHIKKNPIEIISYRETFNLYPELLTILEEDTIEIALKYIKEYLKRDPNSIIYINSFFINKLDDETINESVKNYEKRILEDPTIITDNVIPEKVKGKVREDIIIQSWKNYINTHPQFIYDKEFKDKMGYFSEEEIRKFIENSIEININSYFNFIKDENLIKIYGGKDKAIQLLFDMLEKLKDILGINQIKTINKEISNNMSFFGTSENIEKINKIGKEIIKRNINNSPSAFYDYKYNENDYFNEKEKENIYREWMKSNWFKTLPKEFFEKHMKEILDYEILKAEEIIKQHNPEDPEDYTNAFYELENFHKEHIYKYSKIVKNVIDIFYLNKMKTNPNTEIPNYVQVDINPLKKIWIDYFDKFINSDFKNLIAIPVLPTALKSDEEIINKYIQFVHEYIKTNNLQQILKYNPSLIKNFEEIGHIEQFCNFVRDYILKELSITRKIEVIYILIKNNFPVKNCLRDMSYNLFKNIYDKYFTMSLENSEVDKILENLIDKEEIKDDKYQEIIRKFIITYYSKLPPKTVPKEMDLDNPKNISVIREIWKNYFDNYDYFKISDFYGNIVVFDPRIMNSEIYIKMRDILAKNLKTGFVFYKVAPIFYKDPVIIEVFKNIFMEIPIDRIKHYFKDLSHFLMNHNLPIETIEELKKYPELVQKFNNPSLNKV